MAISTTAKSRLYIGPAVTAAPADAAAYAALAWVEVDDISDLGEIAGEGTDITIKRISDGYARHLKGTVDNGSLEITCLRNLDDDGQAAMTAAAGTWNSYAFKVQLNDMPVGGTAPTVFYFMGPILSAKTTLKTGDDAVTTVYKAAISGPILEVPAA